MKKFLFLAALATAACQNAEESIPTVSADIQTTPCLAEVEDDAADDPAFWLHTEAKKSLIFGSNKKRGLEVYALTGERLAEYPTGRLNNVDVALAVPMFDTVYDIVAASNRDYDRIDIWTINENPTQLKLVSDTAMRTHLEGVYGFCLWNDTSNARTYAFVNNKDGEVEQWQLVADSSKISFKLTRSFTAAGQVEGMVVDQKNRLLYLGEEQGGVFAYPLDNTAAERMRIPMSGEENADLAYDIEGLAIYSRGEKHLLVSSSQGNFRYAAYDINDDFRYLGVFAVGNGSVCDGTEETDGIDLYSGAVTQQYPQGIFLAQDGFNYDDKGEKTSQNFKLVDWRKIETAMQLK